MFQLAGRKFNLARVGLMRAGCPRDIERLPANKDPKYPVVILCNTDGLKDRGVPDYVPKAIVASGHARRFNLYRDGIVRSWAFVEAGALEVGKDDTISCTELMNKLYCATCERLFGASARPLGGTEYPFVSEVYPFENYMVYQWKGQKYKQGYELDPVERRVVLSGAQSPVEDTGFMSAGDAKESMPWAQTGTRRAFAPPQANLQSFTTGGRSSELVTQTLRNWSNIMEAVSMYISYAKESGRKPMRPSFAPVAIDEKNHIQKGLAALGVDMFDFVAWSADAQGKPTKRVAGEDLPPSAFLHVGKKEDTSTWHLPVHFKSPEKSASHVQNALSRVNQVQGIPGGAKARVLAKLRKLAKHKGIGVSTAPTAKQRKWAASGMEEGQGTQLAGS